MKNTIKVTIVLEKDFFVAIFERADEKGLAVAKQIFGKEPTDPELYEFVKNNFLLLRFTKPQDFKLNIKRKNFKRRQKEIRLEMNKAKSNSIKTSFAQEVLRQEIEKNKKERKIMTKNQKEAIKNEKFIKKQEKKKKKIKGH